MNILICGDSFALDWTVWQEIPYKGWPNLIADLHNVENVGQSAVSQYKILKQFQNLDLSKYDKIIVSVSSYWRMYVQQHPIYKSGRLANCDLMLMDLETHNDWFNGSLRTAKGLFKYEFYDDQYLIDIYDMITDRMREKLKGTDHILIGHTGNRTKHADLDFSELWKEERGLVNHYTQKGNQHIFNALQPFLESKK